MKALVIAGGFGTRMHPLTFTRPKPLLPVANRPHVEHVFDLLQRHEINECVLLTSYLAEAFDATIRTAKDRGMTVEVAQEETPLGTAGALRNAAHLLPNETFLALNGDVLTEANLTDLAAFHDRSGAEVTMLLTPVEDPSQFGVVSTAPDGRVQSFVEKPPREEAPTNLINAGIYVMEPPVLQRIPEGRAYSAERELFPELVGDGTLFATTTDRYWMDLGTPQKYLQANLDALAGHYVTDAVSLKAETSIVRGDGVTIADDARVSSSCIGPDCVIETSARVERSVLLPDVVVEAGASVRGSVVGQGARVTKDADVVDATIGDGEIVGRE